MSKVTFTTTFTDEDVATLDRVIAQSPLAGLNTPRNTMIRYIVREYEKLQNALKESEWRNRELVNKALEAPRGGSAPREPKEKALSYQEKKALLAQQKKEQGEALCAALNGRLDANGVCTYHKYEITAGGFTFESTVSEHQDNLSDKHVADQYYPSKEAYEAKLAEEKEKERVKREQAGN